MNLNEFKLHVSNVKGVSILTEMYTEEHRIICKHFKLLPTIFNKNPENIEVILIVHRVQTKMLHANILYMFDNKVYYFEPVKNIQHYHKQTINDIFNPINVVFLNGTGEHDDNLCVQHCISHLLEITGVVK